MSEHLNDCGTVFIKKYNPSLFFYLNVLRMNKIKKNKKLNNNNNDNKNVI